MLLCRLTWNHPLVDGNKRAAWAALVLSVDLNEGRRCPSGHFLFGWSVTRWR
ncbi:MAG: Fic family protein [Acidimicrobiia bacterium]